jgi:ribosomal-protein-alanine N-acetyltransferase
MTKREVLRGVPVVAENPSMTAAVLPADLAAAVAVEARFEPMTHAQLNAVLAVERAAHPHPWSRRHFADTLAAGHQAQCLMGDDTLIGYFIALHGAQEAHLLNLTVAPAFQRQGWALVMLDALALWARGQGAEWLWLEVRASNARAQKIYRQRGFAQVGLRKDYYRLGDDGHEDAVVMNLRLESA